MEREYRVNEGVEEIASYLDSFEESPKVVSIHGHRNAGKSFLINLLREKLMSKGLNVKGFTGNPSLACFNTDADVYLLHCCWDRVEGVSEEDDPERIVQQKLGRNVNAYVGIYNPNMDQELEGSYHFRIRNENSKEK